MKKEKNIVTVGGGTGSHTILSGLKNLKNISLTALVSMVDSGGSTGMLRDELGVLPPGDVRKCLIALSEQDDVVRKLMNYRFNEGSLSGHALGNIILAALEKVTGDFSKGVEILSKILKVKGKVIPITKDQATLSLLFTNGKIINGECNVDRANLQELGIKKVFYKKRVNLNKEAKLAIEKAEYIILGPGDYYTSLIPNLITKGFKEVMKKSKAITILPINLVNKKGHTMGWNVSDYVSMIESYLGRTVDYILFNTEAPSKKQMRDYKIKEGNGTLIHNDLNDKRVIGASLLSHVHYANDKGDKMADPRSFIRHDSKKLAKCIDKIINPSSRAKLTTGQGK